jgi:putative transposase
MLRRPDRRRHSIRLKGYDYSQPGAYFITICAQDRASLFGAAAAGAVRPNAAGQMVERWWLELNHRFPSIRTQAYVVMPNHFHGIIAIVDPDVPPRVAAPVGADLCVRPVPGASETVVVCDQGTHPGGPMPPDGDAASRHRGAPVGADLCVRPVDAAADPVGADLRVRPVHADAGAPPAHAGPPLSEIVQWFKTMTTNEYIRGVKTLGGPGFRARLWQHNYYEHIIRGERSLRRLTRYIAGNAARWDVDRENPAAPRRTRATP